MCSEKQNLEIDENYFDSYAHFGIHEEMLKDKTRTLSYRNAIIKNRELFKDKVVLDVGCGTGILSMFSAQAGAKLVIGVDMSNIIEKARVIIKENCLDDKILLIKGKIEDVSLPVDKVDIIISEWMGYFLLYETMLNSVLFARDKYLVEGGLMFPDKASMHLCAIEDGEYKQTKIYFWEDVYGFDMSCIQKDALKEPLIDYIDPNTITTDICIFKEIDLKTVSVKDLSFKTPFTITLSRDDQVHGFVSYFECVFSACERPITLSTSPFQRRTHWKQTIFYIKNDILGKKNKHIKGEIQCLPHPKNLRHLKIEIQYSYDGKEKETCVFNFC